MVSKRSLMSRLVGTGRSSRIAYLYLVPAFLVMSIITIYPLAFQVWMSFTDMQLVHLNLRLGLTPDFVGLKNYVDVIASQLAIPNYNFFRIVIYNLWWAITNVAIHLVRHHRSSRSRVSMSRSLALPRS